MEQGCVSDNDGSLHLFCEHLSALVMRFTKKHVIQSQGCLSATYESLSVSLVLT